MLIESKTIPQINLDEISRGDVIWAKHSSWSEAERGFITAVDEDGMYVQYLPSTQNVTNHFYISAKEVNAGQWEIRWSSDLKTIGSYPEETQETAGDA